MAEAKLSNNSAANNSLEAELMSDLPKPSNVEDAEEELPWCVICNEDATVRCKDCSDLYCDSCFRECHNNDEEYELHTKEKYTVPSKFKDTNK